MTDDAPRAGRSIGSRRRLLTLAASTLAAVAFAAAVAGRGCGVDDDSPEGAVRAFITAARAGDRAAIHELLGPETRARLQAATARATDLVGGPKRFEPLDLIGIGRPGDDWAVQKMSTRRVGDGVVVDIVTAAGERGVIPVVRVDGHWRIELADYVREPQ